MKTICAFLLLMGVWAEGASAPPANSAPSKGNDFEAFKLIYERNIFNPNRRPPSPRGSRPDNAPPARVDSFSLVGTMMYDEVAYAFFDGSESKFRTVLNPSNSIAGFQLAGITPTSVKLSHGTNVVDLRVGMQMRRQEGGDWKIASGTSSSGGSGSGGDRGFAGRSSFGGTPSLGGGPSSFGSGDSSSASSGSSASASSAPSGSDASADEVLKRLMQKREQEMNK